ncbi:4975_t:CDS:2 [Paraglomus brasilianum]|uniref:4975_t:CDS:1 n=1 Tax=Paraglomus brasilianum TaxID=144538 RepID=A0A9N9CVA0_9GLOM|nr:4975_t:CDS:2 [Paraglomus brasilianum]
MDYAKKGDLRQSLQREGLSRPANFQSEKGQIYGIIPYIAPEVLQGQPYTKASDIYSFGMVAYELFANVYPYYEYTNDDILPLRIINDGLRPNIEEVLIPQLLKDLIESDSETVEFFNQLEDFEEDYDYFFLNTPYRIHPKEVTTSKLINTRQITQCLEKLKTSEEYHTGSLEELTLLISLDNFVLEEPNTQDYLTRISLRVNKSTGSNKQFKRKLSLSAEISSSKEIKLEKETKQIETEDN